MPFSLWPSSHMSVTYTQKNSGLNSIHGNFPEESLFTIKFVQLPNIIFILHHVSIDHIYNWTPTCSEVPRPVPIPPHLEVLTWQKWRNTPSSQSLGKGQTPSSWRKFCLRNPWNNDLFMHFLAGCTFGVWSNWSWYVQQSSNIWKVCWAIWHQENWSNLLPGGCDKIYKLFITQGLQERLIGKKTQCYLKLLGASC